MEDLLLWDILDHHLLNPDIPYLRPEKGHHPSSSSIVLEDDDGNRVVEGTCLRSVWYRKKKYPASEAIDIDALWKMECGNAIHEKIVELIKRCRIFFGAEISFYDADHDVSGRVDFFVLHPERKRVIGGELKTVAGYYGVSTCIDGTRGRKPKPKREHLLQSVNYLDWFSKNQNVHEWWLAYIDRGDTGHRRCYVLTLAQDRQLLCDGEQTGIYPGMVHGRMKELDDYLKSDMVPPRDYEIQYSMPKLLKMAGRGELGKDQTARVLKGKPIEKGDWNCNYCSYKSLCWELLLPSAPAAAPEADEPPAVAA